MVNRFEDLAPLLAAPQGDPTAIRGGKGTVVSWNVETGANVVNFRGTNLTNVPIVAASPWVLQVQPGDEVLLHIFGAGAFSTVHIVGPITPPGPQIRDLIRSAIASNIYSATVAAHETRSSLSYGDLTTVGPTVPNVLIGSSGSALVFLTAHIPASSQPDTVSLGYMSFEVSGATSRAPADPDTLRHGVSDFDELVFVDARSTALVLVTGLNPGLHTFTAKYRQASGTGATNVAFQDRNLTVIAF